MFHGCAEFAMFKSDDPKWFPGISRTPIATERTRLPNPGTRKSLVKIGRSKLEAPTM